MEEKNNAQGVAPLVLAEKPSQEQSRSLDGSDSESIKQATSDSPDTLLRGKQLGFVITAFLTAFALVALDQTILSTALPTIVSHFDAVSEISWIPSAYILPQAGTMLIFGRIVAVAPAKIVFLVSIAIFELGSLFCAVSPSVRMLLAGRAIAGLGGTGIWVSILSVIARITTIEQRPVVMGGLAAVYAISSIVGPLLGGALSDRATWRWCFYINLPIGAIAIIAVFIWLPNLHVVDTGGVPQLRRWLNLDWFGAFLSCASVTLLLIALQWGGNEKPWNSAAVITTLVLFAVLLLAFVAWEHRKGKNAILPLHLFSNITVLGACLEILFVNIQFLNANFYLPLFFQVKGASATKSGIDIIAFMLAGVFGVFLAGGVISATGRPWPFLFFFPLIASVASGLLFSMNEETSMAKNIGYQILLGVGLGAAIQNPLVVAQAEFTDQEDMIPLVTSLVTFAQFLGGSLGLAISGAVFASQLKSQIFALGNQLDPSQVAAVLASVKAIFTLPPDQKALVSKAYIYAVVHVLLIGVPTAALGSLSALLITRRKITPNAPPKNSA